jgi:cold shock CspA family protein
MQGVVKAYDPTSGDGVIMCDTDMNDYELAPNALDGSIFRMLRQGQRVVFQLNDKQQAAQISMGSESDMKTPGY